MVTVSLKVLRYSIDVRGAEELCGALALKYWLDSAGEPWSSATGRSPLLAARLTNRAPVASIDKAARAALAGEHRRAIEGFENVRAATADADGELVTTEIAARLNAGWAMWDAGRPRKEWETVPFVGAPRCRSPTELATLDELLVGLHTAVLRCRKKRRQLRRWFNPPSNPDMAIACTHRSQKAAAQAAAANGAVLESFAKGGRTTVLVVHALSPHMRETTFQFVMSFEQYALAGVRVESRNIRDVDFFSRARSRDFDVVLVMYDVLGLRSTPQGGWMAIIERLRQTAGIVAVFPQDD